MRDLRLASTASTTNLAVLRANKGKIDVIRLDVTIPGASSAEVVAEAAKTQPATKAILTRTYSQDWRLL
jgi:DNA-binding NarL/FixJ family response regulator